MPINGGQDAATPCFERVLLRGMVKGPHPAARKNGEQPTHFQE
ncbi:hypothetical protein CEV34_3280 [Brucella pseudogrignonensis]|uniref:Uncharacterized protein n=1 Tax=Brucella pseudogrignonensis TaxID=419475 RepID=A0A256GA07_9HYPH|nr:hypothetical protein CEV34_3280 [Brucella pseudogrignonensis]